MINEDVITEIAKAYGFPITVKPDRWEIKKGEFFWDSKMDMETFWEKLKYYFFDQGFDEGLRNGEGL